MICQLSDEVKSSIRTGVALTSFAQAVEELVLNSVDAGATSIAVRVDLPCYKVQVVDNGTGITPDQLPLLGERYSTSKCHTVEDLENLKYFGYRGEALASLRAASSFLEIVSKPRLSTITYCKCFRKGKPLDFGQSSVPRPSVGTTITAHDLFYNLPVRRKRLNEGLEIEKIRFRMAGIALSWPLISFSLRDDATGHVILQTRKSGDLASTFSTIFTPSRARALMEVSASRDEFRLSGLVSKESYSRADLQFVFVNKRLVLKSSIHKQVNKILGRSLILKKKGSEVSDRLTNTSGGSPTKLTDRFGIYVVKIECPFSAYDITFDPAKTLVEFKNWPKLIHLLQDMLYGFLRKENLLSLSETFLPSPHLISKEDDDSDDDEEEDDDNDSDEKNKGSLQNLNSLFSRVSAKEQQKDMEMKQAPHDPKRDVERAITVGIESDKAYDANVRTATLESSAEDPVLGCGVDRKKAVPKPLFMINSDSSYSDEELNSKPREQDSSILPRENNKQRQKTDMSNGENQFNVQPQSCTAKELSLRTGDSELPTVSSSVTGKGEDLEDVLMQPTSSTMKTVTTQISVGKSVPYSSSLSSLRVNKSLSACSGNQRLGKSGVITNTLQQLKMLAQELQKQMGDPFQTPKPANRRKSHDEAGCSSPEKMPRMKQIGSETGEKIQSESTRFLCTSRSDVTGLSCQKLPHTVKDPLLPYCFEDLDNSKAMTDSVSGCGKDLKKASSCVPRICCSKFLENAKTQYSAQHSHCNPASCNKEVGALYAKNLPSNPVQSNLSERSEPKSAVATRTRQSLRWSNTNIDESLLLSSEEDNYYLRKRGQSVAEADLIRTNDDRNSPSKRRSVGVLSHSSKLAKLMRGESIRARSATLEDDEQVNNLPQTSCLNSFRYRGRKNSPSESRDAARNTVKTVTSINQCGRSYETNTNQVEKNPRSSISRHERSGDATSCTSNYSKKHRGFDESSSVPNAWESSSSKTPSSDRMPESNDEELPFSIYKVQRNCDCVSSNTCPKVSVILSIPLEPAARKETLPPSNQHDEHLRPQDMESCSEGEVILTEKNTSQTNLAKEEEDSVQASQGFVLSRVELESAIMGRISASGHSSEEDTPCWSQSQLTIAASSAVVKQHNSQSPCLSQGFLVIGDNNQNGEKTMSNSSESPPLIDNKSPCLDLKSAVPTKAGKQEETVSDGTITSEKLSQHLSLISENVVSQEDVSVRTDVVNPIGPSGNQLLSQEVKISSREEPQIIHPFSTKVFVSNDKCHKEEESSILASDSLCSAKNINVIPETESFGKTETSSEMEVNQFVGEEGGKNNMYPEEKCFNGSQISEDIAKLKKMLGRSSALSSSCNETHSLTLTDHLSDNESVYTQARESASPFDFRATREESMPCGQNTFIEMTHHDQDSNVFPFLSVLSPQGEEGVGTENVSSKKSQDSCGVQEIVKGSKTQLLDDSEKLPLLQNMNDKSEEDKVVYSKTQNPAAEIEKQMNQQANDLSSAAAAGDSDKEKELSSSAQYLNREQPRQLRDEMFPGMETYSEECLLGASQENHTVPIPVSDSDYKKLSTSAVNSLVTASCSGDSSSLKLKTADTSKNQDHGSTCELLTPKRGKQDRSDSVVEEAGSPLQLIQDHDNVHTEAVGLPANTQSFTDDVIFIAQQVSSDLTRSQDRTDLTPEDVQNLNSDFEIEPLFVQKHGTGSINNLKHRSALNPHFSDSSLPRAEDVYHESSELNVEDPERITYTAIQTSEQEKGKDEATDQTSAELDLSHKGEGCDDQGNEIVTCWTKVVDSQTGNTVYVNSMSGDSISEDQWSAISSQRRNQMLATESPAQLTVKSPEPLTLVRRINLGDAETESARENKAREEDSDISSKWRDGKRPVYRKELGADVANVIAKWSNPVFLKYKQPTVSATTCPSGIAAKSSFNSLSAVGITKDMLTRVKVLGQLDNKFIVCLTTSESGTEQDDGGQLVLFDQHAVHERIRLEMLTADVYEEESRKQTNRIKRSEVIPAYCAVIDQDDVRIMSAFAKEFDRIGVSFSVEKTRRDLVKILTMPTCIAERETCESKASRYARAQDTTECLIKEHINLLKSTHGACGRLPLTIHKVLCSQACHGAVKFGDPLTGAECKDLLKALTSCHLPFQCAHGRPSVVPLVNLSALKLGQQPARPRLWTISRHLQK